VTFNVVDASGQSWNNGTWSAQLQGPQSQINGPFYVGNTLLTSNQTVFTGSMNGSGSFTQALTQTNTITSPIGSSWLVTVCPIASGSCYAQGFLVTTNPQTISVVPPKIQIAISTGMQTFAPPARVAAYQADEIVGASLGNFYYDLTLEELGICETLPCGWVYLSGGGGSGIQVDTNNTPNTSQSLLNFENSSGTGQINFSNPSGGNEQAVVANIQGSDSKLLSSGTISGTSQLLCTDSNLGATTAGCPGGGGGGPGSGTPPFLPYWNTTTTLANSSLQDQGTYGSGSYLFDNQEGLKIQLSTTNGIPLWIQNSNSSNTALFVNSGQNTATAIPVIQNMTVQTFGGTVGLSTGGVLEGILSEPEPSQTTNFANLMSFYSVPVTLGTGVINYGIGYFSQPNWEGGAGKIANSYDMYIDSPTNSSAGYASHHAGIFIQDFGRLGNTTGGVLGVITNGSNGTANNTGNDWYGLNIAQPTAATGGGTNWPLYVNGGPVYFGGTEQVVGNTTLNANLTLSNISGTKCLETVSGLVTPIPCAQALIITSGICTTSGAETFCGSAMGPYTWGTAFADTNYAVTCTTSQPTGTGTNPGIYPIYVVSKSASQITLQMQAGSASAGGNNTVSEIDCIGVHI